jgi:hypothetical protein
MVANRMNQREDRRRGTSRVLEAMESRVLMSGTLENDYQMAPGKAATFHEMVEDAAGNLYVGGGAIDAGGTHHALVRKGMRQPDGSVAWSDQPVIDYTLAGPNTLGGPQTSFKDIVIDPVSGDLYAAGQALDPAGGTRWVVVKYSPDDATQTLVDDYRLQAGRTAYALGIARDAGGNLFVVGMGESATTVKRTTTSVNHWVVRELKAGATSFQTVQDFVYAGAATNVQDVVAAPSGVYVCGFGSGYWLTQRGVADAGGNFSWTTVDTFKADPALNSSASAAGVDAEGNVYVMGRAGITTGPTKGGVTPGVMEWTVRRTKDVGATWQTIDRFRYSGSTLANSPWAFETDPAGNLYVAGGAPAADNSYHAILRTAPADGTGWKTLDDWQMASGRASGINGLLVDHTGELYAAGVALDASGTHHAYVRRIDTLAGVGTTFSATTIADPSVDEEEGQPESETASLVELAGL